MGTIYYNTDTSYVPYVFRATGGGTVFSANLAGSANFDYFTDTAVANDAIYFSGFNSGYCPSDIVINVGTPLVGVGVVLAWEYYCIRTSSWRAVHNLTDGSNGLTTAGSVKIRFPIQAGSSQTVINGISSYYQWVRCRIVSLTSISEGGANATNRATVCQGLVSLSGYTDAVPCTWTEIYNWVVANAPEIGATKISPNVFKFDNAGFAINSTLRTTGEKIFIGNGCFNATFRINYLWSGTKVGTNGWTVPTDYFFCWKGNNSFLSMASTTRVYGGRWDNFINLVDGLDISPSGAFMGVGSGEWIGVYLKDSGYFSYAAMDRCTVDGGLITPGKVPVYPTNLQIANPGNYIWSIYGISVNIPGVSYALPSVALIYMTAQYADQGQTINIINPNPSFPSQTSAPRVAYRALGSIGNIYKCFFYDSSATTYTDYTTAANNTTADDVPLGTDTGDCLYILPIASGSNTNQFALTFTLTPQSNNYVYAIEYYKSGAWFTMGDLAFDLTNNFTQTGIIYLGIGNLIQSVTVNAVAGFWIRIRVVTPGTGTPTVSRIQSRSQTGIGNYKINEKMSCIFRVVDEDGVGINGASVKLTTVLGTDTNLTTDSGGVTPATDVTISVTAFDKTVSETDYNLKKTIQNPYTITVSKIGFETYTKKMSILSKIDETIKLKTALSIRDGLEGENYLALNPELGSSSDIIEV